MKTVPWDTEPKPTPLSDMQKLKVAMHKLRMEFIPSQIEQARVNKSLYVLSGILSKIHEFRRSCFKMPNVLVITGDIHEILKDDFRDGDLLGCKVIVSREIVKRPYFELSCAD